MKAGWSWQTLGKVCTFENGDRGENYPGRASFVPTGIPIINAGHLSEAGIDETEMNFISRDRFDLLRSGKIRLGDVLFCLRGSLGKFAVNDVYEEGAIASSLIIIRPTEKLDTGFLAAYLQSTLCGEMIRKYENGAAQPNLGGKSLEQFSIPLPPLDEQRRIVAVLDKAFAGIAAATENTQKNLTNARALFESYLRFIFTERGEGWEKLTLKQASLDFGRGKSKHRPRNDKKLYGGPYPFVQTGDIRNCDHIVQEYSQTYSAAGLAQSKLWPKGTICITIAANIAETGILGFDSCFPDSVIGMVVDPARTSSKYVEYLLQSLKALLQSKGKGSAQANINLATFEDEKFQFPELTMQLKIVAKLDDLSEAVRSAEAIFEAKLTVLAELKQSLLQKAFAGDLT